MNLHTIVILLVCFGMSSCSTLESLSQSAYEGTTLTYNVKKNNVSIKTKIGKHLTLKY